ncbi:DUF2079 domain-containing protein [Fischerella sp. JS2]|uniref:DUF2079 domain-containing protein n=1 Tax=Fischerella sp. JS2 TaxID=2597771 RepID=UPI0028F0F2C9|nr:DUF2079 domain-containing protein [Fischerella sp. JS2]
MLVFCLHRFYTFYASYDQGLFDQLFWNTIHGRIFQGSLSSGQSSAYTQDGQIQTVFYCHLGQHFVIDFLLWMPIYALFPTGATLVVLQVSLITAAGLVLYALCRHYLPPSIAILITASFYGANAVIGPTFANFYEHCQIPFFVFSLLLALEKRKWWLFWSFLILILGIREEAGIITFGIGLYLFLSRRYPRLGLAVCLISFSYVTVVTNVVMPLFSNDNSRLYLTARFDQYVPGNNSPSTLQLLWGIITHPKELIQSLFTPVDRRVKYFLGQWLPLAFIPVISPAAWTVAGPPLLVLLMQDGKSALAMSIRYALTVVPGLFYGTILWWSQHQEQFQPSFRRWWIRFIALSILFTITSNPNRAFYFLVPESTHPLVYVPLTRQWEHVGHIRSLMQYIKSDASVSATTFLLPHLATRLEIIRLPAVQLRLASGQIIDVDFAFADLWQLQQYQPASKGDRQKLQDLVAFIDQLLTQGKYGLVDVQDGVVLLQKKIISQPETITHWLEWKAEIQKNSNI